MLTLDMHRPALSMLIASAFAVCSACQSILSSTPASPHCKAAPGSSDWPCLDEWSRLNSTLAGRLLKPLPPTAVCHSKEPSYNPAICNATDWTDATTYVEAPLGIINPNWAHDSCLPQPKYPCSSEWFPVYVINATCAADVAAGVDFARKHNIRLNVKGSGHDYLGRSTAPNSLSIWTYHIRGFDFDDSFRPASCPHCVPTSAVTLGAGEDWGTIYPTLGARNLTCVGGTGDTIGLGGYLTGGGHGPLSAKYGLGADQILEMEVVLASGMVVIANEVLNSDLFWAMRGGGGATFGIMTSVTIKTFAEMPVASVSLSIITHPDSEAFWHTVPYVLSQTAPLQHESGITTYLELSPGIPFNGTTIGGCFGQMLMPNGTVAELEKATKSLRQRLSSIAGVESTFSTTQYRSVHAYYQATKNNQPIGFNDRLGNRLLDGPALSNITALTATMRKATPLGTATSFNAVSGPGLWAAKPAGGSDSVTPAWRKAYAEYVTSVSWPFRNNTAERIQANLLTNTYIEALRELAPDSGSYLNEGDVDEPNFRQAFWGNNYPRLLRIKRKLDPYDVFWCAVCVGNENWEQRGTRLCRV